MTTFRMEDVKQTLRDRAISFSLDHFFDDFRPIDDYEDFLAELKAGRMNEDVIPWGEKPSGEVALMVFAERIENLTDEVYFQMFEAVKEAVESAIGADNVITTQV